MENNVTNAPEQSGPKPGTKEALKVELDAANAALAAANAELEALKSSKEQADQGANPPKATVEVKREKIFVPRGAANDEPNLVISVNGVLYLLPKGKESEVPAHIAAEYRRSVAAQERLNRTKDKLLGVAQK